MYTFIMYFIRPWITTLFCLTFNEVIIVGILLWNKDNEHENKGTIAQ
jgi:hypothetical protein